MTCISHRLAWIGVLGLLILALGERPAAAQRRAEPHMAYAFPAGCRQGETIELVIGGQHLKDATEPHIFGEGVEVELVSWYRPMTRGEYNNLRTKLRDAREKLVEQRKSSSNPRKPTDAEVATEAGVTTEQLIEMQIYRERDRDKKRQPNEQLEEEVTLRLTVDEDAKPGKRELRLLTDASMSNPLWIRVDKWPEVRETEPNDAEPDTVVKRLPIVVNGQIMPGDVDTFSFEARQGQRLVIEAAARDVIPYLADAVPGWFQAVLRLTDSSGNEVSYADSFHYRQDPVIYFEVPSDDRYTVEIRDSLYRGREDFVYRLTIGELPFVTSIFPLGAQVDSDLTVELEGWNLSQTTLDVRTMSRRSYRPVRWFSVPQQNGRRIRFPLQIDYLPEVFDQETNNDEEDAQTVSMRTIINGRIDYPGDQDVFRIQGRGRLVAAVQARRHGSPLDSMLILTDSQGKELAFNDDHEDKSQALLTHHADSQLEALLPGTGDCFLRVSDAQRNGGKDFIYRLYLRAPEPDYELRVVPSSIIARAGAVVPITVFALRKDDFDEEIELELIDPPPGFRLSGGTIPGEAERVRMTLTVPSTPPAGPIVLDMEGKARRGDGRRSFITRPAVPAENMMQAFIWYHLVPVEEWNVIVSGKPGARPPFEIVMPAARVKLPREGDFILPVRPTARNIAVDELQVAIHEAPQGVSAKIVSDEMGRFAIRLTTTGKEVEAGLQGNFLINAYRETIPAATEANPNPQPRRIDYGFLPAVPFEISGRRQSR